MGEQTADAQVGRRASPRANRTFLFFAPLAVLLALWLWLFLSSGALKGGPNGRTFGVDFMQFFMAAIVLKHGGNPYDHVTLVRTAAHILHQQGIRAVPHLNEPDARVGNIPLFYYALSPLTTMRYQTAAVVWAAMNAIAFAVGVVATLRYFSWTKIALPAVVFLALPQVSLELFYGNVVGFLVAALGASLVLCRRHPFVAGLLAAVVWLKPQVALAAVPFIAWASPGLRKPYFAGFATGSALLALGTLILCGTLQVTQWLRSLNAYSAGLQHQPNLSSLSAVYAGAPEDVRVASALIVGAVTVGATAVTFYRYRVTPSLSIPAVAALWILWFLASPYAHFPDEPLLLFPVVSLLGPDARRISRLPAAIALYIIPSLVLLFSWSPLPFNLLCFGIAAVALLLVAACRDTVSIPASDLAAVLSTSW